jgi:hypothetical protein
MTIYSKSLGKGAAHAWVPEADAVIGVSNVVVRLLYELPRHFRYEWNMIATQTRRPIQRLAMIKSHRPFA